MRLVELGRDGLELVDAASVEQHGERSEDLLDLRVAVGPCDRDGGARARGVPGPPPWSPSPARRAGRTSRRGGWTVPAGRTRWPAASTSPLIRMVTLADQPSGASVTLVTRPTATSLTFTAACGTRLSTSAKSAVMSYGWLPRSAPPGSGSWSIPENDGTEQLPRVRARATTTATPAPSAAPVRPIVTRALMPRPDSGWLRLVGRGAGARPVPESFAVSAAVPYTVPTAGSGSAGSALRRACGTGTSRARCPRPPGSAGTDEVAAHADLVDVAAAVEGAVHRVVGVESVPGGQRRGVQRLRERGPLVDEDLGERGELVDLGLEAAAVVLDEGLDVAERGAEFLERARRGCPCCRRRTR